MSVNLVSDESLRSALRPYRVDPGSFEAAVRARLEASTNERAGDPLAGVSPFLRSAAAFLPLPLITGHNMARVGAKMVPAAGFSKILGYIAFPAMSFLMLLAATFFSVGKVRSIQGENHPAFLDDAATQKAVTEWWRRHKWGTRLIYGATLALFWFGGTGPLFLFYIVSFGFLLYVLTGFARLGLGNRQVIGTICLGGLMLLGQLALFPMVGYQEIHFVDQGLIAVVFYVGVVLLFPFLLNASCPKPGGGGLANYPIPFVRKKALSLVIVIPFIAWIMSPMLWPATPSRIKRYVESFDKAPYSTASWREWEIVASWAIERKLAPDLSGARRLLAEEISGEQDSYILGSAFRLGLVRIDQLGRLREYEEQRDLLIRKAYPLQKAFPITSIEYNEWLIRASLLRGDLSPAERDYLEKRLHATLDYLAMSPSYLVEELRVTQLLKAIGRPIDVARTRGRVHDKLRKFHSLSSGGFQLAGGFKKFAELEPGSLNETSDAIELMEIYGVPDGLDLNWVRSFLRPTFLRKANGEEWVAAVTLDRLNHLPGVTPPSWLQYAYYERSLIAAVVLVGLCLYATISSPRPKAIGPAGAERSE